MKKRMIKLMAVLVIVMSAVQMPMVISANEIIVEGQGLSEENGQNAFCNVAEESNDEIIDEQSDYVITDENTTDTEMEDSGTDQSSDLEEPETGTGWICKGENYYFYREDGQRAYGWLWNQGHYYYLDEHNDGARAFNCKMLINGKNYLFDENGIMQTGWVQMDDDRYYTNKSGEVLTGWRKIDNVWYYFVTTGEMQTGWQKQGNSWYYLNESGVMQTGWQYIDGTYYYLNINGVRQTGWVYLGNKWYFLHGNNGAMQTGWVFLGNKWYYLGGEHDGSMKTGWQYIGSKWYYLGGSGDGSMKTGWQYIGNKWYYLKAGEGSMQTGWVKLGNNWYYLGTQNDGSMKTGWQYIGKFWYYLGGNSDGIMKSGWQYIGNKWYYLYREGDKYSNDFGAMAANRVIDGYRILPNGVMSNYYRMQTKISLPSGGYSLSTQNIGLKVIKVNERLFEKTNARYTAATENAVKAFQRNHGLSVTGVVDLVTWKALGLSEEDWYNLGTYCTPMKVDYSSSREECINAMLETADTYANACTQYQVGCSGKPGTYVDCSGLIYQCLYSAGINPDTNIVQHALAKYEYTSAYLAVDSKLGSVVSYENLQPGDLVFYCKNNKNNVAHVAIYAGNGQIYDSWPEIGVTKRNVTISGYRVSKIIRVF